MKNIHENMRLSNILVPEISPFLIILDPEFILYLYSGKDKLGNEVLLILSQTQLNDNSPRPQPNKVYVGFNTKMTLHTTTNTTPKKLNISNISAVSDPILIKL